MVAGGDRMRRRSMAAAGARNACARIRVVLAIADVVATAAAGSDPRSCNRLGQQQKSTRVLGGRRVSLSRRFGTRPRQEGYEGEHGYHFFPAEGSFPGRP